MFRPSSASVSPLSKSTKARGSSASPSHAVASAEGGGLSLVGTSLSSPHASPLSHQPTALLFPAASDSRHASMPTVAGYRSPTAVRTSLYSSSAGRVKDSLADFNPVLSSTFTTEGEHRLMKVRQDMAAIRIQRAFRRHRLRRLFRERKSSLVSSSSASTATTSSVLAGMDADEKKKELIRLKREKRLREQRLKEIADLKRKKEEKLKQEEEARMREVQLKEAKVKERRESQRRTEAARKIQHFIRRRVLFAVRLRKLAEQKRQLTRDEMREEALKSSTSRVSSFLHYLDSMDSEAVSPPAKNRASRSSTSAALPPRSPKSKVASADNPRNAGISLTLPPSNLAEADTSPEAADVLSHDVPRFQVNVLADVKSKMEMLSRELAQKEATISALEEHIRRQKDKLAELLRERDAEWESKLEVYRQDYEKRAEKHMLFADGVLKEKEDLAKQLSSVSDKLRKVLEDDKEKFRRQDEKHAQELKRAKEQWVAAEKSKREEWISAKTKEIKELTVKGLEPEIAKMLAKHKHDLEAVKEEYALEAKRREDEWRQMFQRQVDDARREINSAAEERWREEMRRQATSLANDFEDRRVRYESRIRVYEEEAQQRERQQKDEDVSKENAYRKRLQEQEKHFRERIETERAAMQEDMQRNAEATIRSKVAQMEKELEAKMKDYSRAVMAQRDAQIAQVMEKLEDEAARSRISALREAEEKQKRIRKDAEEQVARIQRERDEYIGRMKSLSSRIGELEEELFRAKSATDSLSRGQETWSAERARYVAMVDGLKSEVMKLSSDLSRTRDEHVKELSLRDEELQSRIAQWDEIQRRREEEWSKKMRDLQDQKNGEMDILQERVKTMVEKRDRVIAKLRHELDTANSQLDEVRKLFPT